MRVLNKVARDIVFAPDCNGGSSLEACIWLVALIFSSSSSSLVDGSVGTSGLVGTELGVLVLVVVLTVGVVTVTGIVVGMVKNGPSVIA